MSPTPPVECLSRIGPPRSARDQSSDRPERVMARVSAAHSSRVMPRKYTAMAKAAIWPSLTEPSTIPATRPAISPRSGRAPSRLRRISSAGVTRAVTWRRSADVPSVPGPKASGRSSPSVVVSRTPSGPQRWMRASRARELGELLAAAPAGRAQLGALGQHHDLGDLRGRPRRPWPRWRWPRRTGRPGRPRSRRCTPRRAARSPRAGTRRRGSASRARGRWRARGARGPAWARGLSLIVPSRTARRWRAAPPRVRRSRRADTTVRTYGMAWMSWTGTTPTTGSGVPCSRVWTASAKAKSRQAPSVGTGRHCPKISAARAR